MWQRRQLRQTIISTGCVGALFGVLPVLALLASSLEHQHHSNHSRPLIAQALELGLLFFGCILFCVIIFGLLPMAVQYCFVWMVRRWTGRA
ncbi:hypothetical protein [Stenotrophomonas sp. PS02298]|uniref:hypothetical protein n=1 Tax=Stenotrophomonas sp. PS02298 TaxID=2991424 RepID=UPI00249CB729|nr:hypothetical protein [Stenotrophomonas sp. PS02298]